MPYREAFKVGRKKKDLTANYKNYSKKFIIKACEGISILFILYSYSFIRNNNKKRCAHISYIYTLFKLFFLLSFFSSFFLSLFLHYLINYVLILLYPTSPSFVHETEIICRRSLFNSF